MKPHAHPAVFREDHLKVVRDFLADRNVKTILDPFAGIGVIHKLRDYGYETWGIEIEPEWAEASIFNVVGDATDLSLVFNTYSLPTFYDAVITSPAFGNRMADHHDARDGSERNTYRHKLGRELHENNSGRMQWGDSYRQLHDLVWGQVATVTNLFILNIKDHIRKGEHQEVTEWHVNTIESKGFQATEHAYLPTRGNRFGENHDARVDTESMIMFTRRW